MILSTWNEGSQDFHKENKYFEKLDIILTLFEK